MRCGRYSTKTQSIVELSVQCRVEALEVVQLVQLDHGATEELELIGDKVVTHRVRGS